MEASYSALKRSGSIRNIKADLRSGFFNGLYRGNPKHLFAHRAT